MDAFMMTGIRPEMSKLFIETSWNITDWCLVTLLKKNWLQVLVDLQGDTEIQGQTVQEINIPIIISDYGMF